MKEIAMIVVEIRYLIIYVFLVLKIKKLVCKVVFSDLCDKSFVRQGDIARFYGA